MHRLEAHNALAKVASKKKSNVTQTFNFIPRMMTVTIRNKMEMIKTSFFMYTTKLKIILNIIPDLGKIYNNYQRVNSTWLCILLFLSTINQALLTSSQRPCMILHSKCFCVTKNQASAKHGLYIFKEFISSFLYFILSSVPQQIIYIAMPHNLTSNCTCYVSRSTGQFCMQNSTSYIFFKVLVYEHVLPSAWQANHLSM